MLSITVPKTSLWDERTEKFVDVQEEMIVLEHSLVSLSKWEQIYNRPFMGQETKTTSETIEYIKCMLLSPVRQPNLWLALTSENFTQVGDYIGAKMTAATFKDVPNRGNGEFISAETIYYWMIALNIPSEYRYWHLNSLIALVRVLNVKNAPEKKMTRRESAMQQKSLNEQRRAQYKTNG